MEIVRGSEIINAKSILGVMMLAGAVASATNVFVLQAIYFANIPLTLLLGMAGLALVSGVFF